MGIPLHGAWWILRLLRGDYVRVQHRRRGIVVERLRAAPSRIGVWSCHVGDARIILVRISSFHAADSLGYREDGNYGNGTLFRGTAHAKRLARYCGPQLRESGLLPKLGAWRHVRVIQH